MANQGTAIISIDRPNIGDEFVRTTPGDLKEACALLSLSEHNNYWKGTLMTQNGVQFVSSDRGMFGRHDYRPINWVWSDKAGTYHPPTLEWSGSKWLPIKQAKK